MAGKTGVPVWDSSWQPLEGASRWEDVYTSDPWIEP